MVSSTVCATLSIPELSHTLTTEAIILSTDSRISPTDAPAQKAIPASRASISIGDFKFRIAKVAFDKTAMGFVPVSMSEGDQVMFVEFELLAGKKEDFKSLEIKASFGSGQKSNAFILMSNGMMQMLATVTMKGISSDYKPLEDNVAWAYVIPKSLDKLYLNFPTGDRVDLTPFLKSSRSAASKPDLLPVFSAEM